jgi:hypothetical protein
MVFWILLYVLLERTWLELDLKVKQVAQSQKMLVIHSKQKQKRKEFWNSSTEQSKNGQRHGCLGEA